MNDQKQLKQKVADAVIQFQREQMSVAPEAVSVDWHPGSVIVTIGGATCQAERDCARDKQGREMVERLYTEAYEASRLPLEMTVGRILGQPVQRSRLTVDSESGDAVLLFRLSEGARRESTTNNPPVSNT